jgi:hypothetical protein
MCKRAGSSRRNRRCKALVTRKLLTGNAKRTLSPGTVVSARDRATPAYVFPSNKS